MIKIATYEQKSELVLKFATKIQMQPHIQSRNATPITPVFQRKIYFLE